MRRSLFPFVRAFVPAFGRRRRDGSPPRAHGGRSPATLAVLLVVGVSACDNTPPLPAAAGLDARTTQQLLERLDRLVAALEATARASLPIGEAPVRASDRTLVATANPDVLARLEALEQALAGLGERNGRTASPIARAAVTPPMDPKTVQQYSDQLKSEDESVRQEARRALFQLTEQQALQQLGTPTWTGIRDGHVLWGYGGGESSSSVELTFVNGRVAVIDS